MHFFTSYITGEFLMNSVCEPEAMGCWTLFVLSHESWSSTCLCNFSFSDITLVAWNWPWWEYLYHRNCQIGKVRAFLPEGLHVKHLSAQCLSYVFPALNGRKKIKVIFSYGFIRDRNNRKLSKVLVIWLLLSFIHKTRETFDQSPFQNFLGVFVSYFFVRHDEIFENFFWSQGTWTGILTYLL